MLKPILVALAATLLLAGCSGYSDSAANPANWFGSDESEPAATSDAPEDVNPLIPTPGAIQASRIERQRYKGTPIDRVSEVTVEPIPGGLILYATGVASTQGVHSARLTPENKDGPVDGVYAFRLEAINDQRQATQGPPQTRDVVVGVRLTDQQLGDTRTIRVSGVQNAIEARRR